MTRMIALAIAAAPFVFVAVPAAAQDAAVGGVVTIYGNDECPEGTVCIRAHERDRFRIPRELSRQLRQRSRERGVPSSQIVREALQSYLGGPMQEDPATTWSRLEPLIGSLTIDSAAIERDALTAQLRRHNWRE